MSDPAGPFVLVRTYHRYTQDKQVDATGRQSYVVSEESDVITPPFNDAVLTFVNWTDEHVDGIGLVRCHWRVDLTKEDLEVEE